MTEKRAQGLDSLIPITPSGLIQGKIAQPSLPIEGSGTVGKGKGKGKEKALGNPGAPTVRSNEVMTNNTSQLPMLLL